MSLKIYHKRLLIFLFLIGVIRLYFASFLSLIPQEAYYWNWSKHLDLSYFDHPPLIAYFIRFFTYLGGDKEIFVRMPALFFSLGSSYTIFKLGKEMYNEKIGFYAALFFNLTLIFAVKGVIVDPDSPLFFFWILTLYFTYQAVSSDKIYYWYLLGISLGLGYLSKYVAFLLIPSIFLFLILSKRDKNWLRRKEPYLAFSLSLIFFLPVIVWNSRHQWVSFYYQFLYRMSQTKFPAPTLFFGHIFAQMGVITPLVFIGLIFSLYYITRKGLKRNSRQEIFLFSASLPTLLVFSLISPFYWIKVHWPLPGYLPLYIAFAALSFPIINAEDYFLLKKKTELNILSLSHSQKNKGKRFLKASLYSAVIFILVAHLVLFLPSDFIPPLSYLHEGWKQMGKKIIQSVSGEFEKGKLGQQEPFIFAANYKLASEINFYTGGKYEVYANNILGEGAKAYDYWAYPEVLKKRNALYVFEERKGVNNIGARLKHFFSSVEEISPLEIIRNGKLLKRIIFYRCYGYKGLG